MVNCIFNSIHRYWSPVYTSAFYVEFDESFFFFSLNKAVIIIIIIIIIIVIIIIIIIIIIMIFWAIALFTVSFSHLHYNVIQRGCEAISG